MLERIAAKRGKNMLESAPKTQRGGEVEFIGKTKEVRLRILERLKPMFGRDLVSADGTKAYLSLKSLNKMVNEKAITKSMANGFTREQHLMAVLECDKHFANAKKVGEAEHLSGDKNVKIHRLNAPFEEGNILFTLKESMDKDRKRIYTLELEVVPRFV